MNSISNETLERLEAYKKVSADVVNKIENNMSYVETLLIYEIMNSNFYNKDKMFFNYQLFSRLTIKKYSKLYEKELMTLKKELVTSLDKDLKYVTDEEVEKNIANMINILNKPIEKSFEDKCKLMIDSFEEALSEIVESNAALLSMTEKEKLSLVDQKEEGVEASKKQAEELARQEEIKKQAEELARQEEIKKQAEELARQEEIKKQAEKERLRQKEEQIKLKQEEIRAREERIRLQKEKLALEDENLRKENEEVESMLGAIDNIYDEVSGANLDDIDYTTFLSYIEDDAEDIDFDTILKPESRTPKEPKSATTEELGQNLSKTLEDINTDIEEENIDFDIDMSDLNLDDFDLEGLMNTSEKVVELEELEQTAPQAQVQQTAPQAQVQQTASQAQVQQTASQVESQIQDLEEDDISKTLKELTDELSTPTLEENNIEDMTETELDDFLGDLTLDDELEALVNEVDNVDTEEYNDDSLDLEDIEAQVEKVDIDSSLTDEDLLKGLEGLEDFLNDEPVEEIKDDKKGKLGRLKFNFRKK